MNAFGHRQFGHGCPPALDNPWDMIKQGFGDPVFAQQFQGVGRYRLLHEVLVDGARSAPPPADGVDHQARAGGGVPGRKQLRDAALQRCFIDIDGVPAGNFQFQEAVSGFFGKGDVRGLPDGGNHHIGF